jgi:6-phosphofructokinase
MVAAEAEGIVPQFAQTTIDEVVENSQQAASSQITQGARAIAKKLGHAQRGGYASAFQGVAPTQANAESLIRGIMSNPSRVIHKGTAIDIYNAAGQGIRVGSGNAFVGLREGALEP